MSDATTQPRSNTSAGTISGATIRADEAAHFGKLAKDWWDPKGSSAMLHRLNPVRLQFLRGDYYHFGPYLFSLLSSL